MLPINLSDTTAEHIRRLIESEVPESTHLEYKEALPGGGTDEKREFLYDVAAMANQVGGDIVYGMVDRRGADSQSTGIADRIAGMRIDNPQTEMARLSNLIKDGIAPRLVGVAMYHMPADEGEVLVVRVPRSWSKPHMVTFNAVNKFVIRGATGKDPMSVEQIGRAFSEQGELGEAVREWRRQRGFLINRNEGPIDLPSDKPKFVFHVIPVSAFMRNDVLRESWRFPVGERSSIHVPSYQSGSRYNADGFIATCQLSGRETAYTQIFRSGVTEYVDTSCVGIGAESSAGQLLGQRIEQEMVRCYEDATNRLRLHGTTDPLYVGFSLVGSCGKCVYTNFLNSVLNQQAIRTDKFTSPEVLVDINAAGEERPYPTALRPLADMLWQLVGFEGTPYRQDGMWNPFVNYG